MAFKEVASLDADVTIAIGKKNKETGKPYPKQAEGYYLGFRAVANKRGESTLHFLQTEAGNLGVWGTTDLDRKLKAVVPGTMVRVTSNGTKPTPNGDMYIYKVELDESNTIDVSQLVGASAPAYDTDGESDDREPTDDDNDSADDDGPSPAQLAADKEEKKRKIEAILNRKSK